MQYVKGNLKTACKWNQC